MKHDLSVLYVEDDAVVRENFQEILEQYFSQVITADNGKIALELYNEHKPNIALLDISIPYVSGLQVASKIRETDSDIQIIILTAYDDQEKLIEAVNLQLFAYLVKPVQYQQFDVVLKKLLKKFESEEILPLSNDFNWNKNKEELFYKGDSIKITNKERLVLSLLCNYPSQYFSVRDIGQEILDEYNINDSECNNIVQLLSRFKKKIINEYNIKNFFIENSYGKGYKVVLRS